MKSVFLLSSLPVILAWSIFGGADKDGEGNSKTATSEQTCQNPNADGTCPSGLSDDTGKGKKYHPVCGLYMAPSSIPHSGWGMYTNQDLKDGQAIDPLDVSIPVVDYADHHRAKKQLVRSYFRVPNWLMHEYYWNSDVIYAQFESSFLDAVIPGFGMLANSHVGLINTENNGAQNREAKFRDNPSVGSHSEYQDLTFRAVGDIPAGHELFAEYGNDWFESRKYAFGDALPLSYHFEGADNILKKWNETVEGDMDSALAREIFEIVLDAFDDLFPKRLKTAIPNSYEEAKQQIVKGTAYATVPNVIRDQDWLEENGMCLDHISPGPSEQVEGQRGIFATRKLAKNSLVAPAPLIHISKQHMEMIITDKSLEDSVAWEGYQLLLNYCYGHKSTSLIFFPYSPAVNLMNNGGKKRANVSVRWSKNQPNPDMMNWNVSEVLLYNKKAGLMMEFYALRDIEEGEEVLIDYGDNWADAWERHHLEWQPPVHGGESYKSAWDYFDDEFVPTYNEPGYPPEMVQIRCWVIVDHPGEKNAQGYYEWKKPRRLDLDDSTPCVVVNRRSVNGTLVYDVNINNDGTEMRFLGVPDEHITYVDRSYTSNLHLRNSFRHEIELPDEMIPDSWKDIHLPEGSETCGLYMATSSIPNAGLGMYTGKELHWRQRVCDGDVAVQVEDYELNAKLRHWYKNITEYDEPEWLLGNYYWNPSVTHGLYEADDVQSIVPGMGMLANSHTALMNTDMKSSKQYAILHRGHDPGAGASTVYHDTHFYVTSRNGLQAGEELFVSYGDQWFEDRDNLGPIPLSYHFDDADETLGNFLSLTNDDIESELATDLWDVLRNASAEPKRFNSAFPKDIKDAPRLAVEGTAEDSLPDRVRSVEWLEQNGVCLDNIRVDRSKIGQAGKGAFATRKIKKGATVLPMPVVHIRRHALEIYASDNYGDPKAEVTFEGMQQLLNYCFGRPDSSLLLYPYSPMSNYVNHNASLANTKLKWSSLPNHLSEWLDRTPEDLEEERHSGLIMELVATRDILPAEEIYVDYGEAWENAWQTHVKSFSPTKEDKQYVPAAHLNKRLEWIKTMTELSSGDEYNFDFEVVQTVCYVGMNYRGAKDGQSSPVYKWKWMHDIYNDAEYGLPCDVIDRQSEEPSLVKDRQNAAGPRRNKDLYAAIVHGEDGHFHMQEIPRKAIQFRDVKYYSDLAFRKGFRHEMHVPKHMFPEAWLDLP